MTSSSKYTPALETLAASTSALCAVHCLTLPLLIGFFPALGATVFGQEAFHQLLLWLVIPLSVVALTMGCREHKDRLVALLGLAGIAMLVAAAAAGHELLGENGERVATLFGAGAIGAGHIRNYMLCRRNRCAH